MALPQGFFDKDEQGCAGGVERALMSATPDRAVALGYAGVAAGKELPTLFEMEVGKTSIGADISSFSQFEAEREHLYAPLALMEIIAEPRIEEHLGKEISVIPPPPPLPAGGQRSMVLECLLSPEGGISVRVLMD